MNTAFLSKTNLLESIDVQLGLQTSITIEKLNQDIKKDIEKSFEEFYENDMKTGFYIQNSDENDDVQFYNYNTEGGWWQLQQGESNQPNDAQEESKQSDTVNQEDKYIFFNKTGNIIEGLNEEQKKKFFVLYQQEHRYALLTKFFGQYDYGLVLIYSGKHQTGNNDVVLNNIRDHLKTFKNASVSNLIEHRSWNDLEAPTGFFRISLFVSKFGHRDDERTEQLDLIEKLKQLEGQNQGLIIIPTIVKEEIKDIIKNDFKDDADEKDQIFEYAQEHRYECLYDSESGDENQSSGESCQDDDEDQDDGDDTEGKDDNKQVFVEK